MTAIRLGCQGWTYPDWVGVFYPPGARQETLLPFYAQVFDTVELDSTFYGPPKPTFARSWARHTPPNFRFAAKVPRAVTHDKRLVEVSAEMQEFARGLAPLAEKLGPMLVQLPPDFTRDADTEAALRGFLAEAPEGLRLAVELRHASWHVPQTVALLRERRAALVWIQWRDLPVWPEITADFLYVRWLGNREEITRYDRVQIDRGGQLDQWAERLRASIGAVDEIYGYVNNHYAGHSPESVLELKRLLGLAAPEARELWPQRELFGG